MKKRNSFITFGLVTALSALPAAGQARSSTKPSPLLPAAKVTAPAQAAAPKQPQWHSRDEYDAFQAMATEKDPQKQISLADAFLQKYANTDFKDLVYVTLMGAYQKTGDSAKAIDSAHKALQANPDRLEALSYLCFAFPFVFKSTDANATTELTDTAAEAKHGLEVLAKVQKPATVSQDQFDTYMKGQRANFNNAAGFVALQQKDYADAVTSLRAAIEDDPTNNLTFSLLGQAYYNSNPPDYNNAIWYLARSVALANAAKSPNASALQDYYNDVYIKRHGSDAGEKDILTQAASSVNPPAGFQVAPPAKHTPTGNQAVDAFYSIDDSVSVGGDQGNAAWAQYKGQPFGYGGQVVSTAPGTDAGTTVVNIAMTDDSKAKDGVYDISLNDTQADAKYLKKGDLVRFQGTISAYTVTPNFALTLDGTINDDDLAAAAQAAKSKKPAPHHRPPRGK